MKPLGEILDEGPPRADEAERGLLSAVLQDPRVIETVNLAPGDFGNERHKIVWRAMKDGARDLPLLKQRLPQEWTADFLLHLIQGEGWPMHAAYYAAEIRDAAGKRRLWHLCVEGLKTARNGKSAAGALNWLRGEVEREEEGTARVEYKSISCAELDRSTYDLEYLVEGVLVARQPCIIAGGKKCLKTSILIDLGISLAMGGHFLGYAKVNRAARVGIMTGESGLATIQETARRIARKAGYALGDIGGLVFSEDLPQFGSREHEEAVRRWIGDNELEVVAVDPAYLCMPGGDAGNLFLQGELLRGMTKTCQDTGTTLLLAHHCRKTKVDPFSPPELEDIAWAGFQEFARQWLLVGRREAYQPGTGEHRLWLSAGGSAGHTALWALDINEGTRETPGGRYWEVQVMRADEARKDVQERQEQIKADRQAEKIEADKKRVLSAMVKLRKPATAKTIRTRAGMSSERFNQVLPGLLDEGHVVAAGVPSAHRKTPFEGYQLAQG